LYWIYLVLLEMCGWKLILENPYKLYLVLYIMALEGVFGINETTVLSPEFIATIDSLITVIQAIGILFLIYVLYVIIMGILNVLRGKKIKKIYVKINEMDKKLDTLLKENKKSGKKKK